MLVRRANAEDVPGITRVVAEAFAPYVERMGRRPRPMDADYAAAQAAGHVWVLGPEGQPDELVGAIVFTLESDHVYVDVIAVDPIHHRSGAGRCLLRYADNQARRHSLPAVRLHTHSLMAENLALYAHLGFVEDGREPVDGGEHIAFVKRRPD